MGSLISKLKELVALNCIFNLQAVPRSCNRVAHELAALWRVFSVEAPILPHLPCCIQSIVAAESAEDKQWNEKFRFKKKKLIHQLSSQV